MKQGERVWGGRSKAQIGTGLLGLAFTAVALMSEPGCSGKTEDGTTPSAGSSADGGRTETQTGGMGGSPIAGGIGGDSLGGADAIGGMGGGLDVPHVSLQDVVFADGVYVAVGSYEGATDGSTRAIVLTSADAKDWSLTYDQKGEVLQSVTVGPDGLYAVGGHYDPTLGFSGPLVLTSQHGEDWQRLEGPGVTYLDEILWTGSLFLAAGRGMDQESTVFSSEDGATWSLRKDLPVAHFSRGASSVLAWGSSVLLSKDEGVSFEEVEVEPEADPGIFSQSYLGFWASGDGYEGLSMYRCCFGEMPNTDKYYALASADGESWTYDLTGKNAPESAVENNGVTVGVRVYRGPVMRREASGDWVVEQDGFFSEIVAGDRFVAVGQERIVSSEDGENWERASFERPAP